MVSNERVIFDLGWEIWVCVVIASVMVASSRSQGDKNHPVCRESTTSAAKFLDDSTSSSGSDDDALSSYFSTDRDAALNQPGTLAVARR